MIKFGLIENGKLITNKNKIELYYNQLTGLGDGDLDFKRKYLVDYILFDMFKMGEILERDISNFYKKYKMGSGKSFMKN